MIEKLKTRFAQNMSRHTGLSWETVEERLLASPEALGALSWMEESGGEPDVIGTENGKLLFADCSAESPASLMRGFNSA